MTTKPTTDRAEEVGMYDWTRANQRYLTAHLGRMRGLLRDYGDRCSEPGIGAPSPLIPAEPAPIMEHEQVAALDVICGRFELSPFERDLLLLCAGVELDADFAPLCAAAQGGAPWEYPTFALALAALPEAHWSALTPDAPLRRWELIHVEPGRSLTRGALRIDERILHYLAGVNHLDAGLDGLVRPAHEPDLLAPSQAAQAADVAAAWLAAVGSGQLPLVHLYGAERSARRAVAVAACRRLGLHLYTLPAYSIPQLPAEAVRLVRLWEREWLLADSVLLIEIDGSDQPDAGREAALAGFVEAPTQSVLLVGSRERRRSWQRPTVALEVGNPTAAEQQTLWRTVLDHSIAGGAAILNGHVERLVGTFGLDATGIIAATQGALGPLENDGAGATGETLADALWAYCRSQARPQLDDLAQRIDAAAGWDELVLPAREKEVLTEIAMHVRQRARVYDTWGFADKGRRGLGISALFAGASGTGKTMAAEVLAQELQLDLYRIDLSAVVSKYIGETEKNLRRVFDAAEVGGAILLFDEADALFGKRSEVKDSHDRYANIEVSYLLQRMEAYRGLAILTTNLRDALDTAFLRRIRFVVNFPFPDAAQRAAIWQRIFPAATPVAGLDVDKLAQLSVAGGNIRNIAVHAAFLAADAGHDTPVTMSHLLAAARREYAKLERTLTEAEVRGWL